MSKNSSNWWYCARFGVHWVLHSGEKTRTKLKYLQSIENNSDILPRSQDKITKLSLRHLFLFSENFGYFAALTYLQAKNWIYFRVLYLINKQDIVIC